MARLQEAEIVLEAAKYWKQQCLLEGGSIFSEEKLWTIDNFAELKFNYVENEDNSEDNFFVKLKRQLEPTNSLAKQLWSEMTWLNFLMTRQVSPDTKRKQIKLVWSWSRTEFPNGHWALGDVLEKGFINPGTAFNTHKPREFSFLVITMIDWFSLSLDERMELLENSWKFAEWLDGRTGAIGRQIRHALLYLLFPDTFEPCVSKNHKEKIVQYFSNKWNAIPNFRSKSFLTIVDESLLWVRGRIEKEHPDIEVNFYLPQFKEDWWDYGISKKFWKKDALGSNQLKPNAPKVPATRVSANSYSLNTILYGPPGTGKTYTTFQYCVEICDGKDNKTDESIHARYKELLEKDKRVEFVTFHQSYGYEEFIEGLRPEKTDGTGFALKPRGGALKGIADRARNDLGRNYVLVIDEINRANISKVFGEAITLLEEDKRGGAENEVDVTLPYSGARFSLPPNLYIVGTMNTADRSIALLDTALRRRFDFEELAPDPRQLNVVDRIDLPKVLEATNKRLEWLLGRDHLIGHAWLMKAGDRASVDRIMRHKIIPMLAEYFHDDWNKVRAVLGGGDEFVEAKKLGVPRGLENENPGEDRFRWTVREEFPSDAYDRLIAGKSRQTDAEAEAT